MAVTYGEKAGSRQLERDIKGPRAKFLYWVKGTYDEVEVYQTILAIAPEAFEGLIRRRIGVQSGGGAFWDCEVDFEWPEGITLDGMGGPGGIGGGGPGGGSPDSSGTPGETTPLTTEFSFDTAGGTQHITQSLNTIQNLAKDGAAAADYKRAIGVKGDAVEGVDIYSAKLEFSISRDVGFITLQYIKRLRDLTGKVNSLDFLHFSAGELLFLGASGAYRDGRWTVTYRFAAAQNSGAWDADSRNVRGDGTLLVPDTKKGWEYVWFTYKTETDGTRNVERPIMMHLEKVYHILPFQEYLGWGA